MASGIPYQVVGGRNSLQAKATEDTVAYMKSLMTLPDEHDNDDARIDGGILGPADFFDPSADAVALMTMHMAKGLEFSVVYLTGAEEGIIPYTLKDEGIDIEEERRLFYVGMTRAKDELFIMHARKRFLYGQRLNPSPSPFISEVPEEYVDKKNVPDRTVKRKEDHQMGLF
jgi:superfamily I DNA/RNA helicase